MLVGLIDSGLGLLPTSAWLKQLRPELDLILLMDPDNAPWGPKQDDVVIERVLAAADRGIEAGAEALVLPCNTASVTALAHLRAHVGSVPVIGTVPAIKPAAQHSDRFAVWATAATTASAYQARLIEEFAAGRAVTPVACHALAESIDRGDSSAVSAAIRDAADRTPDDVDAVVLGCTHYPLVATEIAAALPPGTRLFDSAEAVARQALRRINQLGESTGGSGTVTVSMSGRAGSLPASALAHREGRLLAGEHIVHQ
ncbi:glutamate racemase [Rhodococcus sp. NPDC057297]|uniref:glutamate racemase n=1 Tax=Rhodococcus sp. NPDC057297 TaxID=3346090 RepID=UPI0036307CCF